MVDRLIDMEGFGARLLDAIAPEKPTHFAARIGVAQPTVFKYLRPPPNFSPSVDIVAKMAAGANTSIDYLVTGKGEAVGNDPEVIMVPRYAATLAAGAGSWNEGRRKLDDIPFSRKFLKDSIRRTSNAGLSLVEARGDSMAPTIQDGAMLMIDESDTTLIDDVFAFTFDGEARVKRFRRLTSGLMIMSDNPLYPPETVEGDDLSRIQIIGRVKWVAQAL